MNSIEVWRAIRAVLVADATFVANLDNATAVLESQPNAPLVDGCATIKVMDDAPNTGLTTLGRWEPRIQLNFYSSDPLKVEAMKTRADVLLSIPVSRTQPIDSANYRISELVRRNANDLGPVVKLREDKTLRHIATTWSAVVTKLA